MEEYKHKKIELAMFRLFLDMGQIIVDDYETLDTILTCSNALKFQDYSNIIDIDGMIKVYEEQHEEMKKWYKKIKEDETLPKL